MTKLCGIYLLTHVESGLKYVGQSIDIKRRWKAHSLGCPATRLGRSIAKHGWSAFQCEVVELCQRDLLNLNEEKWIAFYGCMSPNGLNLTTGGDTREMSAESKQKMSISRLGKKYSLETRQRISASNTNPPAEIRAMRSASNTGRHYSAATRLKISLARTGKPMSEKSKLALLEYNTGRKHTSEQIAKAQNAKAEKLALRDLMGVPRRVLTDSQKLQISQTHKGRKQSPETIAKRVAARAKTMLLRDNATIPAAGGLLTQHSNGQQI